MLSPLNAGPVVEGPHAIAPLGSEPVGGHGRIAEAFAVAALARHPQALLKPPGEHRCPVLSDQNRWLLWHFPSVQPIGAVDRAERPRQS
jgi:hypothetical protein